MLVEEQDALSPMRDLFPGQHRASIVGSRVSGCIHVSRLPIPSTVADGTAISSIDRVTRSPLAAALRNTADGRSPC